MHIAQFSCTFNKKTKWAYIQEKHPNCYIYLVMLLFRKNY
jgi:hypothetical protein